MIMLIINIYIYIFRYYNYNKILYNILLTVKLIKLFKSNHVTNYSILFQLIKINNKI